MTSDKEVRQQYEHAEATLYSCFVRALEQHRLFFRCECGTYFEPCLAIGTIDFDALELVMKCAKCDPFAQGERASSTDEPKILKDALAQRVIYKLQNCHTCLHGGGVWREDDSSYLICMLSPTKRSFVRGDDSTFHCDAWQPKKKVKHVNSPAKERTQ